MMFRDKQEKPSNGTQAADTAMAIITWIAGEPDMLQRFLTLSGISPSQIRTAIADPGFLAGTIDFVMGHEPTLMAFCAATDTRPEDVIAASRYYSQPYLESGG